MRRGLLGLALLLAGAGVAPARPVEVSVAEVGLDPTSGSPVVRLVERKPGEGAQARELLIWIGPFEAQAIAMELHGVPPPRPFTHDLMRQLVERLGGRITRVEIGALRDSTYIATLHVSAPGGRDVGVDARPSDAIALALRAHGPILVADELFARSRPASGAAPAHLWGLTLQDLTPEIAAFFEADAARGVLVSDVDGAGAAHEVLRGDVITALDGDPVASVGELTTRAGARPSAHPVKLSLRRAGQVVTVVFRPAN